MASNRSPERPEQPGKKPGNPVARGVKGVLAVIGRTFMTMFLIMVITGSIVASVLTVYIVNFLKGDTEFDLRNLEFNYITTLYAFDETGERYVLQPIRGNENKRIWVNIDEVPEDMWLAAMAAEDRRFMAHQGVDWKLTAAAFLNLFTNFREGTVGGSTITQQVIKNISNDRDVTVERKIKEIFRALALEREYSKDDVMEAYLNTIALGNGTYGIQAAANLYFGKNVDQLGKAECAAIIAITQNPSKWELFRHEDTNAERRGYILDYMLEYELALLESQFKGETSNQFNHEIPRRKLSESEYKAEEAALRAEYAAAKKEKLVIQSNSTFGSFWDPYTYFVDYVIDEVISDLMTQKGYTQAAALDLINNGGLSIDTTVDERIQNYLDEKFITAELDGYNPENTIFPQVVGYPIVDLANGGRLDTRNPLDTQPQCAMVIMDYEGNIKGIAGGRGEKKGDRSFDIATDGRRQTGSSIKPISVYGPAIDLNLITWSTITEDSAFKYNVNGKLVDPSEAVKTVEETDEEGNTTSKEVFAGTGWPINADYRQQFGNVTIAKALGLSLNTVAVKTLDKLTPQVSYDFVTNNLHLPLNPKTDIDYAPLGLGAMSGGVSVLEMTAAFQIFGNGGNYYEPHSYSKVVDNQGNVLLEANAIPRRVMAADSAEVMNKLLVNNCVASYGTGRNANVGNLPTMGKTGTATLDKDQWFIGGTPYYVAGLWLGYSGNENAGMSYTGSYPPPRIWKNIMGPLSEGMEFKEFPTSGAVVQKTFCLESGELATANCPTKETGWYKESFIPDPCVLHNGMADAEEITGSTDDSSEDYADDDE